MPVGGLPTSQVVKHTVFWRPLSPGRKHKAERGPCPPGQGVRCSSHGSNQSVHQQRLGTGSGPALVTRPSVFLCRASPCSSPTPLAPSSSGGIRPAAICRSQAARQPGSQAARQPGSQAARQPGSWLTDQAKRPCREGGTGLDSKGAWLPTAAEGAGGSQLVSQVGKYLSSRKGVPNPVWCPAPGNHFFICAS